MKIFVGNLLFDATEADLRKAFEVFGAVESAVIVMDKKGKNSRGFGFVEMLDDAQAQAAITGLDGQFLMGRRLNVSVSKPKSHADSDTQDVKSTQGQGEQDYSKQENTDPRQQQQFVSRPGTYRGGRRTRSFMAKRAKEGNFQPYTPARKNKFNPMRWRKKTYQPKSWGKDTNQPQDNENNLGAERSFSRDERPARPWRKPGEAPRQFNRDDRSARPWSKPAEGSRSFHRDDRPARPWSKPAEGSRSFSRDERPARPWRKPGEAPRQFNRDDRSSRPWRKPQGQKPDSRNADSAQPLSQASTERGVEKRHKPAGNVRKPWLKSRSSKSSQGFKERKRTFRFKR